MISSQKFFYFASEILLLMSLVVTSEIYFSSSCYFFSNELFFDKISGSLFLLSVWVSILMLNFMKKDSFSLTMVLLLTILLTLLVSKVLIFFLLFEFSMIPTILMIMGWGYSPEKIHAFKFYVYYMVVVSSPLLSIILFFMNLGKFNFYDFLYFSFSYKNSLFIFMMLIFLVKVPMFSVHSWLPRAHVEAPLFGSFALAGVIMKLGGYGMIRFSLISFKFLWSSYLILSIALIGMQVSCFFCMVVLDLKIIIAQSSVVHMNFMLVGLMLMTTKSDSGSLMIMISHGLISCLMFSLADFCSLRSGSRSLVLNKGMMNLSPAFSAVWLISVIMNTAFPPFLGCSGELFISFELVYMNLWVKVCMISYFFMVAVYNMSMFIFLTHGKPGFVSKIYVSGKECNNFLFFLIPFFLLTLELEKFML